MDKMLAPSPQPEVQPQFHDVTIVIKKDYACARVEGVPPEEFGIARNARSIKDCGYCFHEVIRRQADLIEEGYDADQIKKLPSYTETSGIESNARDTVEESQSGGGDNNLNRANREIKITEHYIRMDYEGENKTALYRVTTGGDQGDVLIREGEPEIVEVDCIPFAAMTPVIVTHRFFGRSVADLVMDIQRIKTALMRGMLDNLYLHNNPRVEVASSHADENTLDDLLVSRPGGVVRTRQPGGIQWQVVPDITGSVYPALQYMDATREWRTGVTRQGQGVDPNALQNQVATIANQMFNAAQAKTKLIARIFAETGIRDLFSLLHAIIRKNGSQAETVRLRNKWVEVDPREWKERNDMTINVGLGTGGKTEQIAHMGTIIGLQKEALAAGKTNLVSDANLYNSAREMTRLVGLKNVEKFFTDPATQPPPEPQEDPEIVKAKMDSQLRMQEMQGKAEIEKLQAQADIETQNKKVEADIYLAERKFELEKELKLIEAALKREDHQFNMAAKQQAHEASLMQSQDKHMLGLQQSQEKADMAAQQAQAKQQQEPKGE
jgi:hypothetical protein